MTHLLRSMRVGCCVKGEVSEHKPDGMYKGKTQYEKNTRYIEGIMCIGV